MAVAVIDNWYNFQDGDYNLCVTIEHPDYDTTEELEEAIENEECMEIYDYDYESGYHLRTEYVRKVEKYDDSVKDYVEVEEYIWEDLL